MSDLALGQMPVAHQPLVAVVGQLVGVAARQGRHFGLDGLRQKRSRAVAQGLGQRVRKASVSGCAKVLGWESWKTLVSVWAYHSFSGEVEASNTPTIRSLIPSCRHQLSASSLVGWLTNGASHGASGPFIANTQADDSPVWHCSS